MPEPTVVCVMLTADRPAMAKRAVECFRRQTYTPRFLLVYDTGKVTDESIWSDPAALSPVNDRWGCLIAHGADAQGRTIGELRNAANLHACEEFNPDILIHWDDDDLSSPARIAEQVELLQSSGAEAVGYREMLFWREPTEYTHRDYEIGIQPHELDPGEAWLYSNHDPRYCLGSSLAYWRATWERRPFEALPKARGATGEDTAWLRGVKSIGVKSCSVSESLIHVEPPMICSIHGANTQYYGADLLERSSSWKRAPEWDDRCREAMEAARV